MITPKVIFTDLDGTLLKNYHEISDGLINFYKNKDVLYTVKLNNHSEKTSSDVAKEIEEYLK